MLFAGQILLGRSSISSSTASRSTTTDTFSFARLNHRRARQVGTVYKDGPVVVLREAVLEEMLEYSEQDLTRERGGFLLGGSMARTAIRRHSAFSSGGAGSGNSASLTFTHETWAALTRETERNFPTETLIGWQHTHPGFGIFLSGYDLFIHKNFSPSRGRWRWSSIQETRIRVFPLAKRRSEGLWVCVRDHL